MINISTDYLEPFRSKNIKKFWEELNNEKLFAPKCEKCGKLFFPPRAHCPNCLSSEIKWIELSGEGTLYSWTSVERSDASSYILGIIELKEGIGRSIARVSSKVKELKIGMKMRVSYINNLSHNLLIWAPKL